MNMIWYFSLLFILFFILNNISTKNCKRKTDDDEILRNFRISPIYRDDSHSITGLVTYSVDGNEKFIKILP